MKAKELAELLMENQDMDVEVVCLVGGCTYDNPYPKYKSCDINDVHVWCNGCKDTLVIECS